MTSTFIQAITWKLLPLIWNICLFNKECLHSSPSWLFNIHCKVSRELLLTYSSKTLSFIGRPSFMYEIMLIQPHRQILSSEVPSWLSWWNSHMTNRVRESRIWAFIIIKHISCSDTRNQRGVHCIDPLDERLESYLIMCPENFHRFNRFKINTSSISDIFTKVSWGGN